jgi:hypothetical protein
MAAPPEHTEDLAGVKMVDAKPTWLFMLTGRITEAQEVETGMGNVARNKTSQSDGTQTTPPGISLQLAYPNIILTAEIARSREKCSLCIHFGFILMLFSS